MARSLVATRIDSEDYRRLKELAGKQDRSVAWLARKAIEMFLDNEGAARRSSEPKGG